MAVQQPGVWGIDLGQCALKAIRMELKDGQVVATAFDYIEHPKILSQPDADPDQLTREALEQFLSRNNLRGDTVVISVPGQSGLARFVKLPPVEEKKIADIVRFEAKQQIPFPLEEVVWDYQKLSTGSLTGDFVETEIGLFAMKRDMVNRALHQFKDVNVEVHTIQMAPLALCNFIAYDQLTKAEGKPEGEPAGEEEPLAPGKKACVVALDMGTDSSNLVITDGGKIIWQRPIPIGGNHFTRALTKDLKLTFAKAEHLKRNAAKSPDLRKILASLKSVLNDFVGEVQRSLGYFTNTHRDAQIRYMIGLGNAFRLPGLKQFLQEKLQLEVRKLAKFERLGGEAVTAAPSFSENIMSFGVCYGLALQGLKQTRLQTNLLPHEVRTERIVRAKKPWAVATAACLVLAVAGLAFAKGLENSYVTGEAIDKAKSNVKNAANLAASNKKELDTELDRIKKSEENLERLGAGARERLNWQLLQEYVNTAMPLPNGDRLADVALSGAPVRPRYLNDNAKKAFNLLEERRFTQPDKIAAKEKALEQDQFVKKYLIQVNIEGIMALYTEDLGNYFRKIFSDGILFGMDEAEKKKITDFCGKEAESKDKAGLAKPGWVVEVRGYTYHEDEMKFVEHGFVENLRAPVYERDKKWLDQQTPEVKAQIAKMDKDVRQRLGFVFVYKYEVVRDPVPGHFKLIANSNLRTLVAGIPDSSGGDKKDDSGGSGGDKNRLLGTAGGLGGGGGGGGRDGWTPIGEVAPSVLGGGSGGGFGGKPGGIGPAAGPGGAGPAASAGGGGAGNLAGKYAGSGGAGNYAKMLGKQGGSPSGPALEGAGPGSGSVGSPEKKVSEADIRLQPRTEFVVLFVWSEPLGRETAQQPAADEKKQP
jgi:type IV pilus assembly protein PilM